MGYLRDLPPAAPRYGIEGRHYIDKVGRGGLLVSNKGARVWWPGVVGAIRGGQRIAVDAGAGSGSITLCRTTAAQCRRGRWLRNREKNEVISGKELKKRYVCVVVGGEETGNEES